MLSFNLDLLDRQLTVFAPTQIFHLGKTLTNQKSHIRSISLIPCRKRQQAYRPTSLQYTSKQGVRLLVLTHKRQIPQYVSSQPLYLATTPVDARPSHLVQGYLPQTSLTGQGRLGRHLHTQYRLDCGEDFRVRSLEDKDPNTIQGYRYYG